MQTLQQSTERLKPQFYLHDEIRLAISAVLLHKQARTQTATGRNDDPQVAVMYRLLDMMKNIHFPAQCEKSNKSFRAFSLRTCLQTQK